MENKYYPQIDLLKCLAIISVIVIHTLPINYLLNGYAVFYYWQAIPIFLVVYGVNLSLTYNKLGYISLGQYYSKENILHRCKRILPAFLFIFVLALLFGFVRNELNFSWYNLLGLLPIKSAPGNYFITIVLELLVISPLLVYCYRKKPVLTLVGCFVLNLIFELVSPYIFTGDKYVYYSCFVRVLAVVAIGLYLGNALVKDRLASVLKNKLVWVGIILSTAYIVVWSFFDWKIPFFIQDLRTQNMLASFYPFLIVFLILSLKADSVKNKFITLIGKATYHIFLVQMLYFGFRYGLYPSSTLVSLPIILINIFFTFLGGILFYFAEVYFWKFAKVIRANINHSRK